MSAEHASTAQDIHAETTKLMHSLALDSTLSADCVGAKARELFERALPIFTDRHSSSEDSRTAKAVMDGLTTWLVKYPKKGTYCSISPRQAVLDWAWKIAIEDALVNHKKYELKGEWEASCLDEDRKAREIIKALDGIELDPIEDIKDPVQDAQERLVFDSLRGQDRPYLGLED